jgi:hypothetical protein
MKKDQSISTKGSLSDTLNNQLFYTDCKHQLVKIVGAHYTYGTYINAWARLFSENELKPELRINYSSILAKCLNLPKEARAINTILEENYPNELLMFEEAVEVSLKEITEHCISKGWDGYVHFTDELLIEIVQSACAIRALLDGMEGIFLGDTEPCFEKTATAKSKMRTDMLCEVVLDALGGKKDIEAHFGCAYSLDLPYTSTNKQNEIKQRIQYLKKVIHTFKN